MNQLRQQAEDALQNPNVRAFLDTISVSEGADYDTLVNKGRFNHAIKDLSRHPNLNVAGSTAAGRYQFLFKTWQNVSAALELTDFRQHSQDLAAVELIRRRGALELVKAGKASDAILKCN